jgi:diaminohydroxyphosphoribosylaminopyrimidine deaminase / 5-amino-6-(5-phosphoribosylamino)uracil reductase
VIVGAGGEPIADGYSREGSPSVHAEERALVRVDPGDPRLAGATIYSSMEPCGERRSGAMPCARLIVASGLRRVVFALREPRVFVEGRGAELLRQAGIAVVEMPELAAEVEAVNAHLLGGMSPRESVG